MTPHPQQKRDYIFECKTKGCEISKIIVHLIPDLLEDFGFCCPFCHEPMILASHSSQQSERDKVLESLIARISEAIATMATLNLVLRDYEELRTKGGERG